MPSKIVIVTSDNAKRMFDLDEIEFMGQYIKDLIELCDEDELIATIPFTINEFASFCADYMRNKSPFIHAGIGAFFNNDIDYISGLLECDNLIESNTYGDIFRAFYDFCNSDYYCRRMREYVEKRHHCSFYDDRIKFDDLMQYAYNGQLLLSLKYHWSGDTTLSVYPHKVKTFSNNESDTVNNYQYINTYNDYSGNNLICLYKIGAFLFYTNSHLYFIYNKNGDIKIEKYYDSTQEIVESTQESTYKNIYGLIHDHLTYCGDLDEKCAYILCILKNAQIYEIFNYVGSHDSEIISNNGDCDEIRIYIDDCCDYI